MKAVTIKKLLVIRVIYIKTVVQHFYMYVRNYF
jgi:hypothetical protein